MVWYENLDRSKPYIKDYRGFNLWYDWNNGKHHDMKRIRSVWFNHWLYRMTKHEAHARFFGYMCILPFFSFAFKTINRFRPKVIKEEESLYSSAQFIATISRNQYGFETRASKSFEHAIGVLLGKNMMSHILSQDKDVFRQEELGDEDRGLAGDFTEEDILSLKKEENHLPHVGIVYRRPEKHYLNAKPNDFLSPYKVVGEHK